MRAGKTKLDSGSKVKNNDDKKKKHVPSAFYFIEWVQKHVGLSVTTATRELKTLNQVAEKQDLHGAKSNNN